MIFNLILMIDGWSVFHEIVPRRMSLDLTDDKSTLVQVMTWCRQATNHYPSQCWPRSLSSYGVTRPQWVKNAIGNSVIWIVIPVIHKPWRHFTWRVLYMYLCTSFCHEGLYLSLSYTTMAIENTHKISSGPIFQSIIRGRTPIHPSIGHYVGKMTWAF